MATKTGLAEYLTKRFEAWKKDRQTILEPKWQNALNSMKRVDNSTKKKFKKDEGEDWRDDSYIGITKAKIYTVYSILVEILLNKGQIPFSLEPSPYQTDLMDDQQQAAIESEIDKMEDLIREQQADRKADREMMKKLLSLLIYACCISKYNIESVIRKRWAKQAYVKQGLEQYAEAQAVRYEQQTDERPVPGHVYVSVWNMFWDMEGGDLQTCDGYCERQMVSCTDLRKKKGKPYYIDEAIDRAISEYRKNQSVKDSDALPPGQREISDRKKSLLDLEFWCVAPRRLVYSVLSDIGKGVDPNEWEFTDPSDREETDEEVEILCEMVGDEIIRIAPNQTGERPHKVAFWECNLDELTGDGIPDNLTDIQHLLNGLVRAFMDNKKLSANVILGVKERLLADPSQLDNGIKPGTKLNISEATDDVRKALQQVTIQDVGATLMDAIGLIWSWKDSISQVPEILQGSTLPKNRTDTAYELSQLLQFGSKYIGMGVANFDEAIIEPEVTDLYNYNMMDPNVQEGKGEWTVHAEGFETIQEKLVKTQKLKELLGLVFAAPQLLTFVKVRPHLEGIYSSMDLDPEDYLKSEEEIQQEMIAQQQAQQQEAFLQRAEMEKARTQQLEDKAIDNKLESDQKEQDFQRDIIKDGVKALSQKSNESQQNPKEVK